MTSFERLLLAMPKDAQIFVLEQALRDHQMQMFTATSIVLIEHEKIDASEVITMLENKSKELDVIERDFYLSSMN